MKKRLTALIIIMTLFFGISTLQTGYGASVSGSISSSSCVVNKETTVTLTYSGKSVFAATAVLKYDSSKLTITGVEGVSQRNGNTLLLESSSPSGSSSISARITFRANEVGSFTVSASTQECVAGGESVKCTVSPGKITVKEKTMVGCVKSGKKYSYFDQTGLVVNETEVKDSKIPVVSGLKIKKNKLYSQIKTTNQTKFSEIVEACGESQRYGIYPEKIYVKDQQIYMDFGNIRACLGNQVSAEQIAQIRPILKKLGDKTGILHLESYSENNTTITFEMEDISQEN
mgnify:CR=1 FL=1